ncbi:hypothetical protein ACFA67_004541 [Salmonella enterica]
MAIEKTWVNSGIWAEVRTRYETTLDSLRLIANDYGLEIRTLADHAQRECWQRNRLTGSQGRSLAVIKAITEDPQASSLELAIIAQSEIDQQRVEHEEAVQRTARGIHAMLNQSLRDRDGLSLLALAAASKTLDNIDKVTRRSLGMEISEARCYRLR